MVATQGDLGGTSGTVKPEASALTTLFGGVDTSCGASGEFTNSGADDRCLLDKNAALRR